MITWGRLLDYIAPLQLGLCANSGSLLLTLPDNILGLGLLATFGEVESTGTFTREMGRLPLRNDAVFPPVLWTGKCYETDKRPHFTKYGQDPGGLVEKNLIT